MKTHMQLLTAALLSIAVMGPAWADPRPVAPRDLNRFIGAELYGAAHADLGIVAEADSNLGLIGLKGRHGEFAVLHTSLLTRDGLNIFAPTLSVGNIVAISADRVGSTDLVAVGKRPTITIEEHPYIEEPRDQVPIE